MVDVYEADEGYVELDVPDGKEDREADQGGKDSELRTKTETDTEMKVEAYNGGQNER